MQGLRVQVLLVAAMLGFGAGAHAQAFPTQTMKLIVPFPAGGGTDSLGRLLGQRLAEELGQPLVVENRAGAGGALGTRQVAKATPDGHTLLLVPSGPITVIPHASKDIGYRLADLMPVAIVFRSPFLVVVPATSPYQRLGDLLQHGRGAGPAAAYGSAGSGAASHLGSEMLNAAAGTAFMHVPYKGTPAALLALYAGDVQWVLAGATDVKGQLDGGRLRALAVMSQKRSPLFPQVPSMAEAGLPGLESDIWFGLFVPAKTPPSTVDLLNRTVRKILAEPAFAARTRDLAGEPPTEGNLPAAISTYLEKESAANRALVEKIGLKME